jgi:hypothetical protein
VRREVRGEGDLRGDERSDAQTLRSKGHVFMFMFMFKDRRSRALKSMMALIDVKPLDGEDRAA